MNTVVQKAEWKEEYELGIKSFDEQHKWLFSLFNRINLSLERKQTPEVISAYLKSLMHYTNFHFGAEEQALKKNNYPELETHKIQHQEFIKMVEAYKNDYDSGNRAVIERLMNFLQTWLIDHICKEDHRYRDFVPTST